MNAWQKAMAEYIRVFAMHDKNIQASYVSSMRFAKEPHSRPAQRKYPDIFHQKAPSPT